MAKTKISEFSATPANNTDIDGININEGCAPSGINDAIRELMAQLKDFQTGAVGDSFNGPVGASTASTGAFTTLSATGAITSTLATGTAPLVIASTTKVANLNADLLDGADWAAPAALGSTTPAAGSFTTLSASGAVTLSGGTANGVAYLNGSKVVTSGSALTFNGSTLGVNFTSSSNYKFYVSRGGTAGELAAFTDGTAQTLTIDTAASSILINSANGGALAFGVTTEQMRLTSTGLGIGTSSPSGIGKALNVYGGAGDVSTVIVEGNAGAKFLALYSGSATNDNGAIYSNQSIRFGYATSKAAAGYTNLMTIDTSGNLGLGVTPSAWGGMRALQLGDGTFAMSADGAGAGDGSLTWNGYYNGTNWIYGYTGGGSSRYRQNESGHAWFYAPSGTAGNAISFTQAMTLDASGNLLVGTTSGSERLTVQGAPTVYGDSRFNGSFFDTTSATTGTGSGIAFSGYTNGTSTGATFAQIKGIKENSTAGNVAGAFVISTQPASGTPTERARIDSSGNLLVGLTSDSYQPSQGVAINAQNSSRIAVGHASGVASGDYYCSFAYNGGVIGSISQSGTTAVLFNVTSDQRLKENIADADSASSLIDSLQVRKFDWKADGNHQRYGFIAQELATVAPEAVHQPEDTEQMMAVDYSKLVPMLVKEIQSLRKRLADAGI